MKEKSLAVSKRDRQLLSILLAFILVFLCYYFIAGPAFDNGSILKQDISIAEQNMQQYKLVVEQGPVLEREVAEKKDELTEKYAIFLYKVDEARILYQLDTLMTGTGFAVNRYQQSGKDVSKVEMPSSDYAPNLYPLLELAQQLNPSLIEVSVEGNNTDKPEEETVTEETVTLDNVEYMDIGIGFNNAGYDAIYRFLTSVESLERTYILSDIVIGKDTQSAGLLGQLVSRSISLPKVDEAEADDLVFQPTVPKGRPNPF